jgi:hypothetical protein
VRSRRLTQRLDPPEPYDDPVPTGAGLVHHLQVVDSERLKSQTHSINRTADISESSQALPRGGRSLFTVRSPSDHPPLGDY